MKRAPAVSAETGLPEIVDAYLHALRKLGFKGDIQTDYPTRLLNATDNSIYQCLPQAVIAPKTEADIAFIARTLALPAFHEIKITPRGGGTGTNGQALNETIIVDFSRHLRGIISFDAAAATITVQPGVILDQLNAFLKPSGLFFPPTVSPSNRATLGGMVATDGCGKGSRLYGKTSDYIVRMQIALTDGSLWDTADKNHPLINKTSTALKGFKPVLPDLPRGLSGYYLEDGGDMHKLLAGSEGTLALTCNITFRLLPIPRFKALAVLGCNDFFGALELVPALLELSPLAIETMDDKVLQLARGDYLWHEVGRLLPSGNAENLKAVHFVEFVADDKMQLDAQLGALAAFLDQEKVIVTSYHVVNDAAEMASLWNIRKRCVGLLGNTEGNRRPIPFIEDTAVPPAKLSAYIRELRSLLDGYGLDAGMFGHVDAGCLHVRPALDLRLEQDASLIRILSDEVAALLKKYGGVIWGEHGKGFRAEYVTQLLGAEYADAMRRIKTIFDPHNQLNPGKLATPEGQARKLDAVPLRGEFDRQITPEWQALFPKSTQCNGNGACFNYELNDAMCPSYKVTNDRIHSPKGRAGMLREWLRLISSDKPARSGKDFAHDVYAALDGCLSCKACTAQCPIKVNIPDMKARFLSIYHHSYRRPLKDYALRHLETIAPYAARAPRFSNLILPLLRLIGLMDLPEFPKLTLAKYLRENKISYATPHITAENAVILVQDAFTGLFEVTSMIEAIDLLRRMGFEVFVAPFRANGKAQYVKGFLDSFCKTAAANKQHLAALAQSGIPLVGLEPSVTLTYRQEYLECGNGLDVLTMDEFLAQHLPKIPRATNPAAHRLFLHCTEKTSLAETPARWKKIIEQAGHSVETIATGCCGMAGSYGHETRHQKESRALYAASWETPIGQGENSALVTGFSCRSQIKRFSRLKVRHPVSVL